MATPFWTPPWTWAPPPQPRRKRPNPPVSPVASMLAAQFQDREFGGTSGEFLGDPAEPPPQPGPPLRIDPPPWADELAAGAHVEPPKPPARTDPVAELKRQNGDEKWPEWGPPAPPLPPLQPVKIPPPNWEEEAAERERQAAAANQDQLEPQPDRYPARKGAA